VSNEKNYSFELKLLMSVAWVHSRESQKINWREGNAGLSSFSNAGQSPTAFAPSLLLENEKIRGNYLRRIYMTYLRKII